MLKKANVNPGVVLHIEMRIKPSYNCWRQLLRTYSGKSLQLFLDPRHYWTLEKNPEGNHAEISNFCGYASVSVKKS